MPSIIRTSYILVLLVGLMGSSVYAKGLDNLAPDTAGGEGSDESEKKNKKSKESNSDQEKDKKESGAKVAAEATAAEVMPTRAFLIGTSFGWSGATKDSNTWRASGMADITASYRLPMKVIGEAVFATFRYAPMDVAPVLPKDDINYEYVGVIDAYQFGASAVFKIKEKLRAVGSAELGYMSVTLKDQLEIKDLEIPDESGVNITVGGGADWELLPGFELGPRLYVGFGTFTTFQLTVSTTFAF